MTNHKVALVTGSSRGIGKAIALRLARDGCAVAINYRERRQEAEQVADAIRQHGGEAAVIGADLAIPGDCAALVAEACRTLGPIRILVNNAGIMRRGDLLDFDFAEMGPMRSVNVDGLVHVTRAAATIMQPLGWGRIINLTSVAAIGTAMAGTTFYAATKAAVIALTRRFALDLGPSGITVNAIAPGFILTEMAAASGHNFDAVAQKAMMRRIGKPEDIAATAAFLASEEAGFMTAQVLTVDGGRTDFIAHP